MIGIPLGLAYANVSEWLIHKHVLHGRGKKRESFWSFHFHEHHRTSRKQDFYDPDYEKLTATDNPQTRELLGLIGLAALHAPLLPVAPFFTATVWFSAAHYYHVHRKSHLDPEWAREKLTWHYDHHMGPNQDANWCVTHPWADHLFGTREPYAGTEREQRDLERRRAHRAHREKASSAA
jgi:sterol desaturase/sphingolipid hydroxylase (fatty acid hydroxylase superfamily)